MSRGPYNWGDFPEKKCEYCETVFKPLRGTSKYCGRRCSDMAWRYGNIEKYNEYQKQYKRMLWEESAEYREYQDNYRKENQEEITAKARERRHKNKEKQAEYARRYAAKKKLKKEIGVE